MTPLAILPNALSHKCQALVLLCCGDAVRRRSSGCPMRMKALQDVVAEREGGAGQDDDSPAMRCPAPPESTRSGGAGRSAQRCPVHHAA